MDTFSRCTMSFVGVFFITTGRTPADPNDEKVNDRKISLPGKIA